MNSPSICYKCIHQEDCNLFNADKTKVTVECGRFLMKEEDIAIMNAIYEHFFDKSASGKEQE